LERIALSFFKCNMKTTIICLILAIMSIQNAHTAHLDLKDTAHLDLTDLTREMDELYYEVTHNIGHLPTQLRKTVKHAVKKAKRIANKLRLSEEQSQFKISPEFCIDHYSTYHSLHTLIVVVLITPILFLIVVSGIYQIVKMTCCPKKVNHPMNKDTDDAINSIHLHGFTTEEEREVFLKMQSCADK